jgi:hypothetical protein
MRPIKRNLAIAGAGVAVLAAGGGAYATTQHTSDRQAFLNDAAQRLHVTPQQLENALRGAALDRLDAAVKAGKLTQQQANALKQRLQSGGALGLGLGHRFGFRHGVGPGRGFGFGFSFAKLDAAASYLGLTDAQLRSQLASGKSLADITKARGKSVSGLEAALKSALRTRLDAAVKAGRLTKAQEQRILARIDARIADIVQRGLRFRHP